ncbi:MAG: hypothetical protein Q9192_000492 [Flavoplaca navasiana]
MDDDNMLMTSPRLPMDPPTDLQLLHSDTTSTLPGRPLGTDDTARRSRPETIDFILSCSICQDTLSTLYAQSDKDGLRQGTDDYDGAITKLWLTECAHVTCAKHMEGGGVPFHPKDQPPKAPCPLCVRNNQDHAAKILYAIRGTARGEYDDNIPPEYFEFPPQQLNNSGNEALRYIQDGLTPQDGRDSSMTTRASRYHYKPSPKRRRLYTADSLVRQREHESEIEDVQQRLDRTGIPVGYNPCLAPNGNYPNTSRSAWERTDDGELDRALQPSISGTRSVGQPTPRLTLPPSTPAVKRMTPRRRVGISANARTSQPPFSTPESSSSLQRRIGDRNPGHSAQIVPSPHFSIKTLPTFHTAQRPYTNSGSFSYARKTSTATPKLDGNASKNFSCLPTLRGQVERQDRQRSQAEELGSSSGAYRRPSESRQPNHQPLSLNSFSFTNKPYIGPETAEHGVNASSVHHARRAVRR